MTPFKPTRALLALAAVVLVAGAGAAIAQDVFTADDLFELEYATSARISPDGEWVAYTRSVPRAIDAKAGSRYAELHVVSTKSGEARPFVIDKVNVSGVRWTPNGEAISFLMTRGEKAKRQVWTIRVDGGEAIQTTKCKSGVITYRWHPSGERLFYTAQQAKDKRQKELDEKGYGFTFYEENWKHRNLYVVDVRDFKSEGKPERLTDDITVWSSTDQ